MKLALRNKQIVNQEALAFLRAEGILIDGESLALDVDKKIEAGQELSPVEAGILWHGITQTQVDFVKANLL